MLCMYMGIESHAFNTGMLDDEMRRNWIFLNRIMYIYVFKHQFKIHTVGRCKTLDNFH